MSRVAYDVLDGVAAFTLTDPPANAYSYETMRELDGFILQARMVQSELEMGFSDALALERGLQQRLFESDDAREGIAANLAKRTPEFRGR